MSEQPEAERLLDDVVRAATMGDEHGVQADSVYRDTRAALIAHIQRGAAPDGWQVVPIDPSPGMLDAAEAVDWGDEDTRGSCCNQWHAMLAAAPAPDHFRDATKMMAEPAEVPMPEPVAYGIGNTAITGRTNRLMMVRIVVPLDDQYAGAGWHPLVLADEARTYGAAREAAGYARGWKEKYENPWQDGYTSGYNDGVQDGIRTAALRGEVKP